jgi:hypothetical protein
MKIHQVLMDLLISSIFRVILEPICILLRCILFSFLLPLPIDSASLNFVDLVVKLKNGEAR